MFYCCTACKKNSQKKKLILNLRNNWKVNFTLGAPNLNPLRFVNFLYRYEISKIVKMCNKKSGLLFKISDIVLN